jgi:hypothetical protein
MTPPRPRQPQAAAQRKAELQPGHYVRVFGHLKSYNGKWTVNAFAVRAIHDFNEVGGGFVVYLGVGWRGCV